MKNKTAALMLEALKKAQNYLLGGSYTKAMEVIEQAIIQAEGR